MNSDDNKILSAHCCCQRKAKGQEISGDFFLCLKSGGIKKNFIILIRGLFNIMAIPVVGFSREGNKIRKVFG